MPKFKEDITELIGEKFNNFTVVEYYDTIKKKHFYTCRCECGRLKNVERYKLTKGLVKSCGCKKEMDQELKDKINGYYQVGQEVRGFLIIKELKKNKSGFVVYKCACVDCKKGNYYSVNTLKNGTLICKCKRDKEDIQEVPKSKGIRIIEREFKCSLTSAYYLYEEWRKLFIDKGITYAKFKEEKMRGRNGRED